MFTAFLLLAATSRADDSRVIHFWDAATGKEKTRP